MSEEGLEPVPQEQRFTESGRGFVEGQQLFGRYILRQLIGRGGMGLVWLAHDEALGEEIALKFLPETVRHDATALEELKRDTRRSRKLAHANIVKVYDFVSDANAATISMEFIDGDTLSGIRARQESLCFSVPEIEPWVKQLLNALSYAHEGAKVVHRDLKPANIMVDKHGALKVTDFGIASSINENVTRVTMARGTSGTVCYMSPQQAMGEKPCVQDDIYALGATLFELLTGKPPFFRGDILSQVWETVPPTLAERRGEFELGSDDIPEVWEQTIAACLAKDAAQRPQSMAEIAYLLGMRAPVAIAKTVPSPRMTTQAPPPDSFVVKEAKPFLTKPVLGAIIAGVLVASGLGYYYSVVAPTKQAQSAKSATTPTPIETPADTTPEPAVVAGDPPEIAALRIKAVSGDAQAAVNLANVYGFGLNGFPKDQAMSFKWNLKAAEEGNAQAQENVGSASNSGDGVAKDGRKALAWFQKAADGGNADALGSIGQMYMDGNGVEKDFSKAASFFQKAADADNPGGQAALANLYLNGWGVPQDYGRALSLAQKAASNPANHDGEANLIIALTYFYGWGTAKDYEKAFTYTQKAADQGNPSAECQLGEMYLNGTGVAKDYGKALALFRKGADLQAGSSYDLGTMYENGWGVPKDVTKAKELYRKAAAMGGDENSPAPLALKRLAGAGTAAPAADVAAALQTKSATPDAAADTTPEPAVVAGDSPGVAALRAKAAAGDAKAALDLANNYAQGTNGVPKDPNETFKWELISAQGGNAKAQHGLSWAYANGVGTPKDLKKAFEWEQKSAAQGSVDGQIGLAEMYDRGEVVPQDFGKELFWYQKAADQGDTVGQVKVGSMYWQGSGVGQDFTQALNWFHKAADKPRVDGESSETAEGRAHAGFSLGHMYLTGAGVTQDYGKALTYLQAAADDGNSDGKSELGSMYLNGWGVKKDYAKALSLFQETVDFCMSSKYYLGVMYENGWGVPKDAAKALEYYKKAALNYDPAKGAVNRLEAGGAYIPPPDPADVAAATQTKAATPEAAPISSDALAARDQGLAYLHGDGVAKDPVAGRKLIEAAAEKGDPIAEDALGSLWLNGIGGKKDATTAFTWFKKAADQGIVNSEFNVGLAFYNGTGVEKDFEQALDWFQKAATSDNREAQFNLGQMYENGEGTLRNADKAAEWYKKAAANGYQPAQEAMTRLGQ